MARRIVTQRSVAVEIGSLLDSPEVADLIGELEALRWTGRKGYPIRSLVGACLVKSLYCIPTWTRTVALIAEHAALRDALGPRRPCSRSIASRSSCASTPRRLRT